MRKYGYRVNGKWHESDKEPGFWKKWWIMLNLGYWISWEEREDEV